MTPPLVTLDGVEVTVQAYADRVERATSRILAAAYHRPRFILAELGAAVGEPSGLDHADEDPGVAVAALVTTLAGVVAGGGATWAWVLATLEAQRVAQLGRPPTPPPVGDVDPLPESSR